MLVADIDSTRISFVGGIKGLHGVHTTRLTFFGATIQPCRSYTRSSASVAIEPFAGQGRLGDLAGSMNADCRQRESRTFPVLMGTASSTSLSCRTHKLPQVFGLSRHLPALVKQSAMKQNVNGCGSTRNTIRSKLNHPSRIAETTSVFCQVDTEPQQCFFSYPSFDCGCVSGGVKYMPFHVEHSRDAQCQVRRIGPRRNENLSNGAHKYPPPRLCAPPCITHWSISESRHSSPVRD